MKLTTKILSIAILTVLVASMVATVAAQSSTVYIYVRNPPAGLYGHVDNPYWIGQIPISIGSTSSGAPHGAQTYAYCMDYSKDLYIGNSYKASLTSPPDSAAWKSISYILTWYVPSTNNEAVADQVAIWKLLKGASYHKPDWLTNADNNLGLNLAAAVAGKDVIRQTDTLSWTAPSGLVDGGAVPASPGTSKYFEVQVKDSNGVGRAGVKITFEASPVLTPTDVFTDSNGKAGITVDIPSDQAQGSSIDITASTKGTYPRVYMDLTDCGAQDLIGVDTCYNLTLDADAVVIAHINMVPEIELGTLAAVSLMAFGFLAWTRKTKKNKA
ncbi:MAG: hypothetical protein ACQCN6_08345 [Candidatus Bathyarchaeia archaeon]|jgi:hypothetical protein